MPLSRADLDAIRWIVHEEVARALEEGNGQREPPDQREDCSETLKADHQTLALLRASRRGGRQSRALRAPEGFVPAQDAATDLGVGYSTLLTLLKSGKLTRHKIRNRLYVERAELARFLEQHPPKRRG